MNGPDRRLVRVARDVFEELDRVLGPERDPDGRPSANDFLTVDLIAIVDRFATRFEELPPLIRGREDYRILVSAGTLVDAFAVVGQLLDDGSIEIMSIDLDVGT